MGLFWDLWMCIGALLGLEKGSPAPHATVTHPLPEGAGCDPSPCRRLPDVLPVAGRMHTKKKVLPESSVNSGRAMPLPQGCIRREGTSKAAPAAVRQAVGGGCQSGWGRLLSVTNAMSGTCRQGDSNWA